MPKLKELTVLSSVWNEGKSEKVGMTVELSEGENGDIIATQLLAKCEDIAMKQLGIKTERKEIPKEGEYFCSKCKTPISLKVRDYSKEKYGKVLCYECQKDER